MRSVVYISGPLHSSGTLEDNINNATVAARQLLGNGFAYICPHYHAYVDPYDDYGHRRHMENDISLIARSDAVLRLNGQSSGADEEVVFAQDNGIPVFFSIATLAEGLPRFQRSIEYEEVTAPTTLSDSLNQFQRSVTNRAATPDTALSELVRLHTQLSGHEPHPTSLEYYRNLLDMAVVHMNKQHDYGKVNDPFANVRGATEWGIPQWVGAMVRATDKVRRLQQFALSGDLRNESAGDSFIDLANYAIIAKVLMESEAAEGMVEWGGPDNVVDLHRHFASTIGSGE